MLGQRIGNYHIIRLIGQGSMGAVFEAIHEHIERRAAIKVLHPEYSRHPEFRQRFINEARAVNLVRHPGLVEIFEFGYAADGTAFLIMEFLEGESLKVRMQRTGPLGEDPALDLTRQVAVALAAAHAKDIVHRDLKPDNIILLARTGPQEGDQVKVLDFGLAKMVPKPDPSGAAPFGTADGVALGTPVYMAPEQCVEAKGVDDKADVYSLGVILYEMLAGRAPFVGRLPRQIMCLHIVEPPPPLSLFNEHVSKRTTALIEKMLAKQAAQRPAMEEVAAEIREIACGRASVWSSLVGRFKLSAKDPSE